jgi:hypothetical protein
MGRERTMWVCFVTTRALGNDVGAEGATALASALERNSVLQHLRIGSECAVTLECMLCAVCDVVDDDVMLLGAELERTVWLSFVMCGDGGIRQSHW